MKKLTLAVLMVFGVSGMAAAAEQSDAESNHQCVYQGQVYGIGSPISVEGKTLICVQKQNRMTWVDESVAGHYL
ncbi:DUF1496 domain-containing protein [Salmonella enterica]|nr:DUF1496 domain-containing protein [Salmonella enterica]ELL0821850.1 DUF1496 domain-containing protein [Salmonella enterica]